MDIPEANKLIPTYVWPITMVDTIVIEDVGIDSSMEICRSDPFSEREVNCFVLVYGQFLAFCIEFLDWQSKYQSILFYINF